MDGIYRWEGREVPLIPGVCVLALTIDKIDNMIAEGTILCKDYWEHGIEFQESWDALGLKLNGEVFWVVSRKEGNEEVGSLVDPYSGEHLFTANPQVNDAIKAFAALHLNAFLAGKKFDPPEAYRGPVHAYSGPCLCAEISASSADRPFDWNLNTEGGMFPQCCFECSCGARWHCIDPIAQKWLKVAEVEVWHMLMEHNGVPVRQIGILNNEIYLLETLCELGYVLY